MKSPGNEFLDANSSESSDQENGYDSDAVQELKGNRGYASRATHKRRKLSLTSDLEDGNESDGIGDISSEQVEASSSNVLPLIEDGPEKFELSNTSTILSASKPSVPRLTKKKTSQNPTKVKIPGVIYLSSLPPYLRPSALRNLLTQRGFFPINRLFLVPAPKAKGQSSSKKSSRQLYTEGWIEFTSKKVAKLCAETLNATPVGGPKAGWYHDDLWNMRYLRGMSWDELMAGVNEERREEEGRRDEERRVIKRETEAFIKGVEEGRRIEGISKSKKRKKKIAATTHGEEDNNEPLDSKRAWRQYEVKSGKEAGLEHTEKREVSKNDLKVNEDAKRVLRKIF